MNLSYIDYNSEKAQKITLREVVLSGYFDHSDIAYFLHVELYDEVVGFLIPHRKLIIDIVGKEPKTYREKKEDKLKEKFLLSLGFSYLIVSKGLIKNHKANIIKAVKQYQQSNINFEFSTKIIHAVNNALSIDDIIKEYNIKLDKKPTKVLFKYYKK